MPARCPRSIPVGVTISLNVKVRGAGYWKLRTQSFRVVRLATSVTEVTVDSPA